MASICWKRRANHNREKKSTFLFLLWYQLLRFLNIVTITLVCVIFIRKERILGIGNMLPCQNCYRTKLKRRKKCAVDWRAKKRCDLFVSHDLWSWSLLKKGKERDSSWAQKMIRMMIKKRWTSCTNIVFGTGNFYS